MNQNEKCREESKKDHDKGLEDRTVRIKRVRKYKIVDLVLLIELPQGPLESGISMSWSYFPVRSETVLHPATLGVWHSGPSAISGLCFSSPRRRSVRCKFPKKWYKIDTKPFNEVETFGVDILSLFSSGIQNRQNSLFPRFFIFVNRTDHFQVLYHL